MNERDECLSARDLELKEARLKIERLLSQLAQLKLQLLESPSGATEEELNPLKQSNPNLNPNLVDMYFFKP